VAQRFNAAIGMHLDVALATEGVKNTQRLKPSETLMLTAVLKALRHPKAILQRHGLSHAGWLMQRQD